MMKSEVTAFAPGRVNLIGEHTDYNQGLALPFAIEQGVTVYATPLPERRVEVTAEDLYEHDGFDLDAPTAISGWRAFVRGAAAELQRAGIPLRGGLLRITGTVPRGGGLSSSAALEVALTLALCKISSAEPPEPIELARLCSRIENEWVGAQTGLLDQLAALLGEQGKALRIDFRTLLTVPVPLGLDAHRLVTVPSGEIHSHDTSGYNERRQECARACELLGMPSLREATLEAAAELPAPLDRRVRHVVTENERVDAAVAALSAGDLHALGELLDASHESLRDCYEISTPAVERAIERCRAAGALGARIMGGGFGGNVLALLPPGAQTPEGAVEVVPGAGARVEG